MNRICVLAIAGLACVLTVGVISPLSAETIVGDVFLNGYDGWTDVTPVSSVPSGVAVPYWYIPLLGEKCLTECSDGYITTSAANAGTVKGFNMVNTSFATPENYHLKATMATWDDDGFGILFGYKDENNYYRVSFRIQSNGNLGYPKGVSIQKVVNGTVTQHETYASFTPPLKAAVGTGSFDVDIAVTGSSFTVGINGGAPILSHTESGSTLLTDNHAYGVHSWYQTKNTWNGTELHSMSVTDSTNNVLKSHTFTNASPVAWTALKMKNSAGTGVTQGLFHFNFSNGTIVDDTNGYQWATTTKPNVDFIGPAVVLAEAGNAAWSDYEMKVRMSEKDNDGIGLLLRASIEEDGDATAFYRVNFCSEAIGTGNTRAPQGMSIQKFANGTWSELFRDDQVNPKFVYTPGTSFDVKATVVGNAITVQVNGLTYDTVYDTDNPILTGTAGFTNWGSGGVWNGVVYSAYGGVAGTPLLVAIPEPSTWILLGLAGMALLIRQRRR
jgi:hypothetical protein